MTKKYDYKIFPETFKARLLLALAFVGGLLVIGAYFTFWIASSSGLWNFGWLDEMEVTYANNLDEPVIVYLDNDIHATVPAKGEVVVEYRKIEWWWNRDVLVMTEDGRVLLARPYDKDDLEDIDYRIVVEDDGP